MQIKATIILHCRIPTGKSKMVTVFDNAAKKHTTKAQNAPQLEWMASLVSVSENQDHDFQETNPKVLL